MIFVFQNKNRSEFHSRFSFRASALVETNKFYNQSSQSVTAEVL